MFKCLGILVGMLLILPTVSAQDRASIRLGPALGSAGTNARVTALVNGSVPTTQRMDGGPLHLAASAGAIVPLFPSLYLRSYLTYGLTTGTISERTSVSLSDGTQIVQGVIRRDHDVTSSNVTIDAGITWSAYRSMEISAAGGYALAPSMSVFVSDHYEQPSGATFVSSGSADRSLGEGTLTDGPAKGYFFGTLELASRIPLPASIHLAPYAAASYAFTSALENDSWHPLTITAGVRVGFDLGSDSPSSTRPEPPTSRDTVWLVRLQKDTTLKILPYKKGQQEDTVVVMQERILSDTVLASSLVVGEPDTLVVTGREMWERQIPGAQPFLSVIVSTTWSDLESDTSAKLHITIETLADTSFQSNVEIVADGEVIRSASTVESLETVTVRLADIVGTATVGVAIPVEVRGTSMDAYGNEALAIPRRMTVTHVRRGFTIGESLQK